MTKTLFQDTRRRKLKTASGSGSTAVGVSNRLVDRLPCRRMRLLPAGLPSCSVFGRHASAAVGRRIGVRDVVRSSSARGLSPSTDVCVVRLIMPRFFGLAALGPCPNCAVGRFVIVIRFAALALSI